MLRKLLYGTFKALGYREAARFAEDTRNLRQAQFERLLAILSQAGNSSFGKAHAFKSIKSIEDFQNAVPISDYSSFQPYIERAFHGESSVLTNEDPFMFAITSGTSGNPKYIPVTNSYLSEFRRASVVSGYHLLDDHPGIAKGVTLSITSPAQIGASPAGIPYGSISGLLFQRESWLMRRYISPIPYSVYLIPEYDARYYTILRLALQLPVTCFYTLNPSTIRILVQTLRQQAQQLIKDVACGTSSTPGGLAPSTMRSISHLIRPDCKRALYLSELLESGRFYPHNIWPDLRVVACWTKAAATFYLDDFSTYFGGVPVTDISYGASEGRGTVYRGEGKQTLALRSHFFEFVPEEEIDARKPTVLTSEQLEAGRNYYILFTTSGGLYRYHINDVVKVRGFDHQAPFIEFQYKGGNVCSFTGEKITELQVSEAMSAALHSSKQKSDFFTVIPRFKPEPHYEVWIEPDAGAFLFDARGCAAAFDRELSKINLEYQSKRESRRLAPPEVFVLAPGTYRQLRAHLSECGVPDSQIKISHLNPKGEIQNLLKEHFIRPAIAAPA